MSAKNVVMARGGRSAPGLAHPGVFKRIFRCVTTLPAAALLSVAGG